MPDSRQGRRRQFTLRTLLTVVALAALPLAVMHYGLYGPEVVRLIIGGSTGILAVVVAAAVYVALLWGLAIALAVWWNNRSERPTFGGLVVRVIVIGSIVGLLVVLMLPPPARE